MTNAVSANDLFAAFEIKTTVKTKKFRKEEKIVGGNKYKEMSVLRNVIVLPARSAEPVEETRRSGFEEEVVQHFASAYNLARWLTRNPSDAEDVVQEAYMRAFKFFGGFKGGDSRAWILRIVRNTFYTWMQNNRSSELVYELQEELYEDEGPGPEAKMIENSERQWLRKEIDSLPPTFKEVLVLRHIEDLSYKEIASIIDLPVGTVMSRLARARAHLQKQIGVCPTGGGR